MKKWKMKRRVVYLFCVIALIFLVSPVYASIDNSDNRFTKNYNLIKDMQISSLKVEEEIDGYIIELREKPLIVEKIKLDSEKEEAKEKTSQYLEKSQTGFFLFNYYEKWRAEKLSEKYRELKETGPKELVEQNEKIAREHEEALDKISNLLGREVKLIKDGKDNKNGGGKEFGLAFNGFVLDITKQEAEGIKKLREVKNVYPNYIVHTLLDESVPAMEIDLARNYAGLTGEGVVIAVIDTGIDATHESLDDLDDDPLTNDPKVIGWMDYINFKSEPYDDHGHGTHVSGIAAGTGGGTGYVGVAPRANLVGVKVLNSRGSGTFSGVIAGIEWVIQNKDVYNISVISMSLGASVNSDGTTPVEIAADYAVASGINFVVAAGNSGPRQKTVGIPASAKDVITVGAVDKNLNIASFSSRGPTKDGRIKPEISAVGVRVMSSVPLGYVAWSGTSMATPHVSGFVALLLQQNPSLTTTEVKELLMDTAVDKGEEGPDNTYGYGVLNGLKTLFELSPPEHEIAVSKVNFPDYLEVGEAGSLEAEIENLGLNNENVEVELLVDGIEQETNLLSISAGRKEIVSFTFTPDSEREYEIKIKAVPLASEATLKNNERAKVIKALVIAGEIKAVVADSWGTDKAEYTIFDYLNKNWMEYGDYVVTIDYKTLNKEDITYDDIVNSGADVLIISNAWTNQHFGFQFEFKDSEIEAIKQYVKEGHGLIGTSGTLSEYVQNNIKLAELFGIRDKIGLWNSWDSGSYYPFNILVRDDVLTKNLPASYWQGYGASVINLELDETKPVITVAKILKKEDLWKNIFVSAYKPESGASVYFTPIIEIIYGNEKDKQFFYNAIVWTSENTGQLTEDIAVFDLQAPEKAVLNDIALISAEVKNNGIGQKDVVVEFLVDDIVESTQTVNLLPGERKEVSFSKQFSQLGNYIVSVSAVPSGQENYIINNKVVANVLVPSLMLTGTYNDYGLDMNNNSLYDYIVLNLGVNVFEAGWYNIRFTVASFLGAELDYVYDSGMVDISNKNITIQIPIKNIRKMGLDGPYKIKNFELYFYSNMMAGKVEEKDELLTTKPYKISELEVPSSLTGNFNDYGLDEDNNGLYDWLVINAEVDIRSRGEYLVTGSLWKGWNMMGGVENRTYIDEGIHNILLRFDGNEIRNSRFDGPYNLKTITLYKIVQRGYYWEEFELIDSKSDAYETFQYNYTQFETKECVDFDGFDVAKASYVKEEGITYADICEDGKSVREYYCEFDMWKMKRVVESAVRECKNVCMDGACAGQQQEWRPCMDTDPTNKLDVKGEVTYNGEKYVDKCEEAGKSVREYFCYKEKMRTFVKRCPDGTSCVDGVCTS